MRVRFVTWRATGARVRFRDGSMVRDTNVGLIEVFEDTVIFGCPLIASII